MVEGIEENVPFHLGNTIIFLSAIFISAGFAIQGVQQGNQALILVGSLFAILGGLALGFTKGSLLKGTTSLRLWGLTVWIGMAPFLLLSAVSGQFSLFSVPTAQGAYLNVLAGTSSSTQAIFNKFLAVVIENRVFVGAAIPVFLGLRRVLPDRAALGTTALLFGVVFGRLHGVRSVGFLLMATVFMGTIIAGILGEDTGVLSTGGLIAALGVADGAHWGNNISAGGGPNVFVSEMLAAGDFGLWILGLWVGSFILAVVAVIDLLQGDLSWPAG